MIVMKSLIIGFIGGRKMRNRDIGQLTMIEIIAIVVIALIFFLVVASVFGKEPTQDYKLEECMRRYNDFNYCKYKLGVE